MSLTPNFSLINLSCIFLSLLLAAILGELFFNFRKKNIEGNTNLSDTSETSFIGKSFNTSNAPEIDTIITSMGGPVMGGSSMGGPVMGGSPVMETENNMIDSNDFNNNLPSVQETVSGLPVVANDGNQVSNNPIDPRMNTFPEELTIDKETNQNQKNTPNGSSIKSNKNTEIPDIIYKTIKVREPKEEHPHVFTLIYEPPIIKSELMESEKKSDDEKNVEPEKMDNNEKSEKQKEEEKVVPSSFDAKSVSSCATLYDNNESYSKRLHDSRLDFGNMGEINTSIIQGCKP